MNSFKLKNIIKTDSYYNDDMYLFKPVEECLKIKFAKYGVNNSKKDKYTKYIKEIVEQEKENSLLHNHEMELDVFYIMMT